VTVANPLDQVIERADAAREAITGTRIASATARCQRNIRNPTWFRRGPSTSTGSPPATVISASRRAHATASMPVGAAPAMGEHLPMPR